MINIPYIKIPQISIWGIPSTLNVYPAQEGSGNVSPNQPTPITYLTQWKIVGNSEVHGVGNLTSWKVSGNSVVDNNTILSCGDLGQDGKYHVKISNGVTIFDIPLDAPLRKVNDVADTIEFSSSVEGKALVTRNFSSILIGNVTLSYGNTNKTNVKRMQLIGITAKSTSPNSVANILCSVFETKTANQTYARNKGISVDGNGKILIFDPDYTTTSDYDDFKAAYADTEIIYELATPTTELIDVSPFPVSPIDTYTSANVVPFSAFEHTENMEIWSCGEYNATDGKYHILVQPQGGSIADIALDAPLRKVNDIVDTIEFPSGTEGKALVTRFLSSVDLGNFTYTEYLTNAFASVTNLPGALNPLNDNSIFKGLIADFEIISANALYVGANNDTLSRNSISLKGTVRVFDPDYKGANPQDIKNRLNGVELIYELATPTTELVDAPQIQEAESYSMVISQGGKAVSWSSFTPNPS